LSNILKNINKQGVRDSRLEFIKEITKINENEVTREELYQFINEILNKEYFSYIFFVIDYFKILQQIPTETKDVDIYTYMTITNRDKVKKLFKKISIIISEVTLTKKIEFKQMYIYILTFLNVLITEGLILRRGTGESFHYISTR
jgi:hypothetical protein